MYYEFIVHGRHRFYKMPSRIILTATHLGRCVPKIGFAAIDTRYRSQRTSSYDHFHKLISKTTTVFREKRMTRVGRYCMG